MQVPAPRKTLPKISSRALNVFYGTKQALSDINIDIEANAVTALIGPSGCGKSTFLRSINRMNDTIENCRVEGTLIIDGENIYAPRVDPVQLRARIGMVFQKPNPFPKSIYDNVAYGPRIHGILCEKSIDLDALVEISLIKAARVCGTQVKDRLSEPGTVAYPVASSRRLCIARTIAVGP